MTVDTRSFKQIWESLSDDDRSRFRKKCTGLAYSTINCYVTGHRSARGPSLECLKRGLKRFGINVGDGQHLFPHETTIN